MSLKYLISTWTQILTGRGAIPCKSCPKSRVNSLSFKGLWIQTRRAQEEPQLIRANAEVSHRAFLSLRGQTRATHWLFLTRKPRGLTLTVRVSAALLPVPRDELAPLLEVTRETGSGIARENHSQVFEPKLHHSQQHIPCCYRVHPRQAFPGCLLRWPAHCRAPEATCPWPLSQKIVSISDAGAFGLTQLLHTQQSPALDVLMQIPAGAHSSMLIAVHEILNLCLILSR